MSNRAIFETGVATDAGRVRTENEDAFLVHAEAGVWAVADGMGGHKDGALASATAVRVFGTVQPPTSAADLLAQCESAAVRANAEIRRHAGAGATIGTTLVVLLTHGTEFASVWSGDSRLYRIRGGLIEQWTEDHTEVQELLASGTITPDQARTWPRRNVVTRALGALSAPELDIRNGDLRPGDTFVLCSDGLSNHVSPAEIAARIANGTPQAGADALLALTLERGATDNVTVLVVRCLRMSEQTVALNFTPDRLDPGPSP